MNRAVLLIVLLLCRISSTAQFFDKAWLVGFNGEEKVTYNSSIPDTQFYRTSYPIYFNGSGSNVSDTSGNILLLANGMSIGGGDRHLLDNGDTLTDLLLYHDYPAGFPQPYSNIILPKKNNQFYFIYISESDSLHGLGGQQCDRLYCAVVDMNANGGQGKVISKKNVLWKGSLIDDTRMTACRHANGRDWWFINHGFNNDEYHSYLVTPDSIYPPIIQHAGPITINGNIGQSVFSADGSIYATAMNRGYVSVYNFDRCSGIFSFIDSFLVPGDTIWRGSQNVGLCDDYSAVGCAISSSGRYLYVTTLCRMMQYDLQADTIWKSGVEVAQIDTSILLSSRLFNSPFLMPNGEILMCSWNGAVKNFHQIKHPDQKGDLCDFRYYGFATNAVNADGFPNMINYRMGPLVGSACDTLHVGINEVAEGNVGVKVYPNPATERILIGLIYYHKNARLEIYDAFGKEVYRNESIYLDDAVDIRSFSSGIYLVKIFSPDGDVTAKFVKE